MRRDKDDKMAALHDFDRRSIGFYSPCTRDLWARDDDGRPSQGNTLKEVVNQQEKQIKELEGGQD